MSNTRKLISIFETLNCSFDYHKLKINIDENKEKNIEIINEKNIPSNNININNHKENFNELQFIIPFPLCKKIKQYCTSFNEYNFCYNNQYEFLLPSQPEAFSFFDVFTDKRTSLPEFYIKSFNTEMKLEYFLYDKNDTYNIYRIRNFNDSNLLNNRNIYHSLSFIVKNSKYNNIKIKYTSLYLLPKFTIVNPYETIKYNININELYLINTIK